MSLGIVSQRPFDKAGVMDGNGMRCQAQFVGMGGMRRA